MNDTRITLKYILIGIIVVIFTWTFHEFAHWLTSELLRYDTAMYLNATSTLGDNKPNDLHRVIISATGPAVTLLQGWIVFLLLKNKKWYKYGYLLLFTACYMRFLAGLMNGINPNDEGRISAYLGWGTFTLPIIVCVLLFLMVRRISKQYHLSCEFQLANTLIVMFVSSPLILSNSFVKSRLW